MRNVLLEFHFLEWAITPGYYSDCFYHSFVFLFVTLKISVKEWNQHTTKKNHEGFEGDHFLADKVKSLIDQFGITWAIETGTYRGATTIRLSEWVERVDTIEINGENFAITNQKLKKTPNAFVHLGSSDDVLLAILFGMDGQKNVLFYLDAHWNEHNPLLEELSIIADHKIKPVIVIHDFKVPGHPELGFDSYGGQDYEWEWIKESVEKIYGVDGYNIEYNSEATGAKRGVIFITPKN